VKMVQVGARDEAKLLGGVGDLRPHLCCSTWLTDFRPISIQMAKRQNLAQPVEDLGPVRPAAVLPGLRGRPVPNESPSEAREPTPAARA
jgi:hypothetical protein